MSKKSFIFKTGKEMQRLLEGLQNQVANECVYVHNKAIMFTIRSSQVKFHKKNKGTIINKGNYQRGKRCRILH